MSKFSSEMHIASYLLICPESRDMGTRSNKAEIAGNLCNNMQITIKHSVDIQYITYKEYRYPSDNDENEAHKENQYKRCNIEQNTHNNYSKFPNIVMLNL